MMSTERPNRWTAGGLAALFTGAVVTLSAVGGCTAIAMNEYAAWSGQRDHDRACRDYENRHNRPDGDDRMYAIPQGTCPGTP